MLREYFSSRGIPVRQFSFWDDVAVLSASRVSFSWHILGSDGNIGTPEHPAERRDKNTQSFPLLLGRCVLYLLDVVHLRRVVAKAISGEPAIVIFDRYIYDQLAALPMQSSWARAYARLILKLAPRPLASYLIDAVPELARARKPEYPLEFMRKYRSSYLILQSMSGLQLIAAGDVPEVHQAIVEHLNNCVLAQGIPPELHTAVIA